MIPVLFWSAYLWTVQGWLPQNHNFIHLTIALGDFGDFLQVPNIVDKYGSTVGVLTAHWSNPFKIAAFGMKEAVKFPFGVGFRIIFLAAGWLLPGLFVVLCRRSLHGPWLGAFIVGLFLTGIGGREWSHYYLMFLPFCAILVAQAIDAVALTTAPISILSWAAILVSTAIWSPTVVRSNFLAENWSEIKAAIRFLSDHKTPDMLVSSTALTLSYGGDFLFLDQSDLGPSESQAAAIEALRDKNVSHLVVTERHTLNEYPFLADLLEDDPKNPPAGIRRELLITSPKRLAIYRLYDSEPPPAQTPAASSHGPPHPIKTVK